MRDDNQNKPKLVDREEGGVGVRQDSGRKRAQEKLHPAMISSAGFSSAGKPPLFLDPFFPMGRAPKSILDHGCTLCALPQLKPRGQAQAIRFTLHSSTCGFAPLLSRASTHSVCC